MRTPSLVLAALCLVLAGCPAHKTNVPLIAEVRGQVSQGGVPLAVGDVVDPDREIVVGEGRATIELPDGATLRLYANTRVRVARRNSVRLFVGKLWALIAPRFEKRFEVETENAVAGVRGTELIVEASPQRTRVAVVTGEVEVENRGPRRVKRRVSRGQEVIVQAEAPPSEPAPFTPEPERKAWEELGDLPAISPEEDRTEAPTDEEGAIGRPKNQLEREGEETRRRLIEEGERTKRELKKESRETKRRLEEEEAKTRRKLEEAEKRAKEGGSVKDFLD